MIKNLQILPLSPVSWLSIELESTGYLNIDHDVKELKVCDCKQTPSRIEIFEANDKLKVEQNTMTFELWT